MRIQFLHWMLFIVSFFIGQSIYCQPKKGTKLFIDTATQLEHEWNYINIGFPEDYSFGYTTELAAKVYWKIDTISQTNFNAALQSYTSKLDMDTSIITQTDSTMILYNGYFSDTFPANRICECTATSFGGLLVPLNLYLIHFTDMHNEMAYSRLMDVKTGKSFNVPSCSDEGPKDILLSPKSKYLLSYNSAYYYNDHSCVYLLKVDHGKTKKSYSLKQFCEVNLFALNIENLVWFSDSCFLMEVTRQESSDQTEVQPTKVYLKFAFKGE